MNDIKAVREYHEVDTDQGVERIYLYYKSSSTHLHTDKQEVDLIESPVWGQMLFLDGTLQSTSKDEVIYHNALVHPLMANLSLKKNILILGGGEGATLREVLRWPVDTVTMVDYDKELVKHMKEYGSTWSQGAFDDPRVTLIYDDAWEYLATERHYDGVIVDLTDPKPNVEKWKIFLLMVMEAIQASNGSFVMNAGLYVPWDTHTLALIVSIVKALVIIYPSYTYYVYTSYIPSFNGEWTFILVHPKSKGITHPGELSVIPAWIRRTIKTLDNEMIYYSITTMPSVLKITSGT